MGWREDLIEYHEKQIASMRQGIDLMEARIMETGEWDLAGRHNDTTADSIAYYKRVIADLETLIAKIKADI